jgi:hypothetical protein
LSDKSLQRITWRRDKVRELTIKGHTQRDIAARLQVSLRLVEKDLTYPRTRAKENITKYIDEYLPAEYENCLDGLNNILTEAWTMAQDGEKREKMQALSLAKECYAMKIDLLSNATVVDRAVKFVQNHKVRSSLTTEQNSKVIIDDPQKGSVTEENNTTESIEDTR